MWNELTFLWNELTMERNDRFYPGAAFLFMLQSSDRLDVCCCVLSALVPASQESRKAVCRVCIQEQSFKKYENGTMKLSVNEAKLTGL